MMGCLNLLSYLNSTVWLMNHPLKHVILRIYSFPVWASKTRVESGGMRVTQEFQTKFPVLRPRRFWLLAVGIAVTPLLALPGWADNYNLESVDFASTGSQTSIILHTGSIVPVDKVMVSDNKLILDIDQINASETVHTNFSGAANISHVIMQPLNEHKIRMIVRGENLGTPSVAFYNAGNGSYNNVNPDYNGSRLQQETSAGLRQIQDAGTQPATLQGDWGQSQKAVTSAQSDEPIAFGGLVEPGTPKPVTTNGKGEAGDSAPLPLNASDSTPTGTNFFEQLAAGKLNTFIPYGLLGALFLGMAGFICYKVMQLKQGGPADFEDLLEEQSHGKKVGFREMANAYREKHEPIRPEPSASNRSNSRKTNSEDVIGLRSLHWEEEQAYSAQTPVESRPATKPTPKQSATLEQMIAAMQAASTPKAPIKTPAPKKQAVNQYLQQTQAQQPQAKPKSRPVADEMMIREQKRAQALQQELQQQVRQNIPQSGQPAPMPKAGKVTPPATPVNRAPAAQKAVKTPNFQSVPAGNAINAKPRKPQPPMSPAPRSAVNSKLAGQQGPLPGNPEVLNFLRNVADLMEKDGKGEIARSIHKNLNPKNIGTV